MALPDTSPDFPHPNFLSEERQHADRRQEDRRQEDRRQAVRLPIQTFTTVVLENSGFRSVAQLTNVSLSGFQVQHQPPFLLLPTFILCREDERIPVRTVWEQRGESTIKLGFLREEVYLIRRLQGGDAEALWQLMSPHLQLLRKFVFSILHCHEDTEDVLQDVMVKVLMHCGQFHAGRSFRAWLMQIARNEALKLLRGVRRHGTLTAPKDDDGTEADCFHHLYSPRTSPADQAERNELTWAIRNEVSGLETKYRHVFLLRHWLQMDMPEVARELGITVDVANTRLHRAHEVIRNRLKSVFRPASRSRSASA